MTGRAGRACVVGWPVEHSRSPLIHGYWLKQYGIDGEYVRRAVRPGGLDGFFDELRAGAWRGANVTLPHKSAALSLSDAADAAARSVGAANTLVVRGSRVEARNTDVGGFVANLDEATPGWERKTRVALVLGAGGGARAVVWALLERGIAEVRIANRTHVNAESLRERFGASVVPLAWADRDAALHDVQLLVNTTSLGMAGSPALDLDVARLTTGSIVNDLVYVPLETPLLAAARARGLRCADGLGMLLHQAAPGFEAWFGVAPRITGELRALVTRDIAARG